MDRGSVAEAAVWADKAVPCSRHRLFESAKFQCHLSEDAAFAPQSCGHFPARARLVAALDSRSALCVVGNTLVNVTTEPAYGEPSSPLGRPRHFDRLDLHPLLVLDALELVNGPEATSSGHQRPQRMRLGRTSGLAVSKQWLAQPHGSESSVARDIIAATVDERGNVVFVRLNIHCLASQQDDAVAFGIVPAPPSHRWSGSGQHSICFSSVLPTQCAVARGPSKTLEVFDFDRLVGQFPLVHTPHHVTAVECEKGQAKGLYMVAEGRQLSLWDVRQPQPAMRDVYFHDDAFVVASGREYFAAAGADRNVAVLDPRTWRNVGSCRGPLKYDVGYMHFSSKDETAVIVASGTDSELSVSCWQPGKKAQSASAMLHGESSLRADGRWLGVDRCASDDVLFGLSVTGHFYRIELAPQPRHPENGDDDGTGEQSLHDVKRRKTQEDL